MTLIIHEDITSKLNNFINNKKIPNLILHGESGSGKKAILFNFLKEVYKNEPNYMKNLVMIVNCAHGKGIRFIREDLKFFAKTNINIQDGSIFKSIILLNADKLTIDAQSALRRCIELFSGTTRFFMIVDDKYKLLKPILSRFCEIFIPLPSIKNKDVNLHEYKLDKCFSASKIKKQRRVKFKTDFEKLYGSPIHFDKLLITNNHNHNSSINASIVTNTISNNEIPNNEISNNQITTISKQLYEKGYSGLDLIEYIHESNLDELKKYELLIFIQKIKREFREERLLIACILHFLLKRLDYNLENITFM